MDRAGIKAHLSQQMESINSLGTCHMQTSKYFANAVTRNCCFISIAIALTMVLLVCVIVLLFLYLADADPAHSIVRHRQGVSVFS
jgi:hypothetical protein